jgi:phosphoribosylformylglycinamidine synthase subunit PurQ / glutaminase
LGDAIGGQVRAAKALVIEGDGINCEEETTWALRMAGFEVSNMHVSELLKRPQELKESKLLCLPGGFSFGDEIASGKVLAVKIRHHMLEQLQEFIDKGNLLLAICNGFQVVVQMGLLPNSEAGAQRLVSLTRNVSGKFINRWVSMKVTQSPSTQIYFAGLQEIDLPMRHGEGNIKLMVANEEDGEAALEPRMAGEKGSAAAPKLKTAGQEEAAAMPGENIVKAHAALRYTEDVNGSYDRIAALTNKSGTVMGLMPHPEAFVRWTQHPQWTSRKRLRLPPGPGQAENEEPTPDGLRIFKNAYNYVQNAF